MPHVLAIYEIGQSYGGCEEGGWWFDTGQLVKILAADRNEDRAIAKRDRINRWLDRLQAKQRPVSRVAYDGGRYQVFIYRDVAPPFFPPERPIYQ